MRFLIAIVASLSAFVCSAEEVFVVEGKLVADGTGPSHIDAVDGRIYELAQSQTKACEFGSYEIALTVDAPTSYLTYNLMKIECLTE